MIKIHKFRKGVLRMSETLTQAMTTAMTSVKTDVMGIMEKALPAGLAIMGVVLAVSIGIKFFKKIASK